MLVPCANDFVPCERLHVFSTLFHSVYMRQVITMPYTTQLTQGGFLQMVEWMCKKFGTRFLWHLPLKSSKFSTAQLPPKDLMLPDFGKRDNDLEMSSESFKHRFLKANRTWIIEQLRGALSGGMALCCVLILRHALSRTHTYTHAHKKHNSTYA